MRMFRCLLLAGLVLLAATPAWAHFVWIDSVPVDDTKVQARVYFSEVPQPGSARLVDRLKPTEAWENVGDGEPRPLALTAWRDEAKDQGALVADIDADHPTLTAKCRYGVFQRGETSMLLEYYARHLPPGGAKHESRVALPLDLKLAADGGSLTVLWNGNPAPDAEVVVADQDDNTQELKSDAEGVVKLANLRPGKHAVRAKHVEADKSGELDGKAYSQIVHYSTLTFTVSATPSTSAENRTAEQVLAAARAHRAVWENFPGFRTKLKVWLDGTEREGTMTVSKRGRVKLEGLEGVGPGFVDRHLSSLVMHRMAGSQFDEGAEFMEDDHHVLGRKLKLAEAQMGSIYRIKDDVVTEVNRSMGGDNFTISVIDTELNAEGKYMPRIFTVSFWDEKSGHLKSTESVYHQWTRVAQFDLPARLVVVATADDNRRQTVKIDFTDIELLTD